MSRFSFEFEIHNNGIQNTLTSATNLSDGRIAVSGLGGVVTVIDFNDKENISTCVRQDRLGNNAILEAGDNSFLIIGQKGSRFHNMNECEVNSLQANSTNTWLVTDIN